MSIVKRLWDLKSDLQRRVFGTPPARPADRRVFGAPRKTRVEPPPRSTAPVARMPPLVTPVAPVRPLAVPVPVVDRAKCTRCGDCLDVCATDAITMEQAAGISIDQDRCIGCGACVALCPEQALSMEPGS